MYYIVTVNKLTKEYNFFVLEDDEYEISISLYNCALNKVYIVSTEERLRILLNRCEKEISGREPW